MAAVEAGKSLERHAQALLAAAETVGHTDSSSVPGRWVEASSAPRRWANGSAWFGRMGRLLVPTLRGFDGWAPAHYMSSCPPTRRSYVHFVEEGGVSATDDETVRAAFKLLNGRTLLFIGDSLTTEVFLATDCWFREIAIDAGGAFRGPAVENFRSEIEMSCFQFEGAASASVAPARVCYTRPSAAALHRWADRVGSFGVIVANEGLRFGDSFGRRSEGRDSGRPTNPKLAQTTASLLAAVVAVPLQRRPLLVWRETTAQHFPTANAKQAAGEWATNGKASHAPARHGCTESARRWAGGGGRAAVGGRRWAGGGYWPGSSPGG